MPSALDETAVTQTPEPIPEFSALDDHSIRGTIVGSGRPAVLRGLVSDWPVVREARISPAAAVAYLRRFDSGALVDAIMTPPEIEGRVFYNDSMSGFNFIRNRLTISAVAEQVLRYGTFPRAPAVAAQSALVSECLPGFGAENRLALLDESILPRIWLGTAITTPTHLDEWNNIGCVAAGRRRFTLFPPQQIGNLYIGPLDFAPTGAPMSLVRLDRPDFARFPRFREALASAVTAELEPGDAIFIPPLWWHHVESLEPFNLLVNYWWHAGGGDSASGDSAFDCLLHAILNLRQLPPATRAAWGTLFEHYVFGPEGGVTDHIPPERLGVLARLAPADAERLRTFLAGRLQKKS
jgi:Cupin-like domain